ncbi:MAG: AAA family ATPase [Acidimicrobiia bacterium]|nr:AAA family ATPase [Acidimicrobiia bacterium]
MTDIVLVAGAGGVGKTTISAGIGVCAARAGKKSLVLTVDPARRLATALGLESLDNMPHPNPELSLLWAAMLNASASWEAIAHRHAPPEVADRLVTNPFFEAVATRFPAGAAYAAGEEMAEEVESGHWDLVVVDTPPSHGGIEFLNAPGQMKSFVGGRILRILTGGRIPGRNTLFDRAAKPALRLMDTVLGGELLEDIGDFLFDLRHTYEGIARRSQSIIHHLEKASMVLVTTTDPAPLAEAARFVAESPGNTRTPIVTFNRSLPESWVVPQDNVKDPRLAENLKRWGAEAGYQRDVRDAWTDSHAGAIVNLAWRASTPNELPALESLARPVWAALESAR